MVWRRSRVLLYFWPGLPSVWIGGAWSGLILAVGFGLLLNWALVSTFVWTELVGPLAKQGIWLGVAVVWSGAVLMAAWQSVPPRGASIDASNLGLFSGDWFSEARDRYLAGDWIQTELLIERGLGSQPDDVEARLLKATMLRRSGRLPEAASQLTRLAGLPGAAKWELEIQRERERLSGASHDDDRSEEEQPQQVSQRP